MKLILPFILVVFTFPLWAQPAAKAIEDKSLNLKDRYQVLKSNSQTYEDYKVIKEHILDGFWNLTIDSIAQKQALLLEARNRISTVESELQASKNELKAQQAAVEDIVYDSTHITVLGIPFSKTTFLIVTAIVVATLTVLLIVFLGRMKILNSEMREKELTANSLTLEFEEYKRKALEKQTKLSRELQNERNKILEIRGQNLT